VRLDSLASGNKVKLLPIGEFIKPIATSSLLTRRSEETFTYIDLSAVDQHRKEITEARTVLVDNAPSRARQVVQESDVLVSTVRPNLNGVAPVTSGYHGAIASTGFCVLRAQQDRLDPSFLMHWVKTETFVSNTSPLGP